MANNTDNARLCSERQYRKKHLLLSPDSQSKNCLPIAPSVKLAMPSEDVNALENAVILV